MVSKNYCLYDYDVIERMSESFGFCLSIKYKSHDYILYNVQVVPQSYVYKEFKLNDWSMIMINMYSIFSLIDYIQLIIQRKNTYKVQY